MDEYFQHLGSSNNLLELPAQALVLAAGNNYVCTAGDAAVVGILREIDAIRGISGRRINPNPQRMAGFPESTASSTSVPTGSWPALMPAFCTLCPDVDTAAMRLQSCPFDFSHKLGLLVVILQSLVDNLLPGTADGLPDCGIHLALLLLDLCLLLKIC